MTQVGAISSAGLVPTADITSSKQSRIATPHLPLSASDQTLGNTTINNYPAGDYLILASAAFQHQQEEQIFLGYITVGGVNVALLRSSQKQLNSSSQWVTSVNGVWAVKGLAANTDVHLTVRELAAYSLGGFAELESTIAMVQLG